MQKAVMSALFSWDIGFKNPRPILLVYKETVREYKRLNSINLSGTNLRELKITTPSCTTTYNWLYICCAEPEELTQPTLDSKIGYQ